MKFEFSEDVIEILEYLCDKLGIAFDWTNQNIVPYLGELIDKFIQWQVGTSVVWIIISILTAIFASVIFITLEKHRWIEDTTRTVLILIFLVCALIVISKQVFDIVECYTFPEKAIYDWIQWKKSWS